MTDKKQRYTQAQFVKAFNELANDDAITASDLRDLVETLTGRDLDEKTVRAHLRKIKARDQATLKNARWRIDSALAASEVEHYARRAQ